MAITYLSGERIQGSSTGAKTPTLSFDLSSASGWTQSGNNSHSVDTTNSQIDWDATAGGQAQLYYDIGSGNISDTAWVLRFKFTTTASASGSGSSTHFGIGLTNSTAGYGTNQNHVTFTASTGNSGNQKYQTCIGVDESNNNDGQFVDTNKDAFSRTYPANETVWIEMKRTSATSLTTTIYTDEFVTSAESRTRSLHANTGSSMRYLMCSGRDQGADNLEGTIEDIKFYNSVTSAITDEKTTITNVPTGTRFEEIDTRKIFRFGGASDTFGSTADAVTVAGVTLSTADKKLGTGSLDYDGASGTKIRLGVVQALPAGTADYTYAFWVKFDNTSGDSQVFKAQDGVETYINSGDLKFKTSGGYTTLISSVSTGTWYHIIIENSGGTTYGYYNGGNVQSASSATIGSSNLNEWYIGGKDSGSEAHDGHIDDFAIWHRALTSAERTALYNSGNGAVATSIDTTGLKYYLNCDSIVGKNNAFAWKERGTAA